MLWPEARSVVALVIGLFILSAEHSLLAGGPGLAFAIFGVLLVAIVTVSVRVARHAEALAHQIGDPYGTMILTLSAVLIEVVILAIILSGESSPTLVRDTIYAAVMLDINGIIGLAALLGGLKHGEQPYNDDSGRTYGVMIITAMGISMIVPEFVPREHWQSYSVFTILAMVTLYTVFLRMQVGRHSGFFRYSYSVAKQDAGAGTKQALPPVIFSVGVSQFRDQGDGPVAGACRRRRRIHIGGAGNPYRPQGSVAQPNAGGHQHRHGRVALNSHPDGTGDGGAGALSRPTTDHGNDAAADGHGSPYADRGSHQPE
jgi:Ca2+/H+ antiporter